MAPVDNTGPIVSVVVDSSGRNRITQPLYSPPPLCLLMHAKHRFTRRSAHSLYHANEVRDVIQSLILHARVPSSFAWTLGAACPQVSLKTSTLPLKATAGRTATLQIKLQAPFVICTAVVVLKLTLPAGVVLQTTRQNCAPSQTRATSLEQ